MVFSEQDYLTLSKFEENFKSAVNARYSRPLSENAINTIHRIYYNTTHDKSMERINKGCGRCIMILLTACGKLFLKDSEEREPTPKVVMNKGRQNRGKSK